MCRLAIVVSFAVAISGCSISGPLECDCAAEVGGLVLRTDGPVTRVVLGGEACKGAHFRCIPAAVDDTIHGACPDVQVLANAPGVCHVELTVGARTLIVDRTMIEDAPGCCSAGIIEATKHGEIDLTGPIDAGVAAEDAPPDGG